jgi:hypothetical protein
MSQLDEKRDTWHLQDGVRKHFQDTEVRIFFLSALRCEEWGKTFKS